VIPDKHGNLVLLFMILSLSLSTLIPENEAQYKAQWQWTGNIV